MQLDGLGMWVGKWWRSYRRLSTSVRRRRSYKPFCEVLEDRRLLATIMVTTSGDGPGTPGVGTDTTLRGAISIANSGDTITFASSLVGGNTITLNSELQITKSLTITGLGASDLTVSGGGNGRVFDITNPAAIVDISGLTITDGSYTFVPQERSRRLHRNLLAWYRQARRPWSLRSRPLRQSLPAAMGTIPPWQWPPVIPMATRR